jgi:hypothetical protein
MKLISATALVVLTTLPAAAAPERPGPGDPIRPSGGICPAGTHLVHVSGERGIVDPDTRAYDDAEYTCEPDQQLEDAREGQGRITNDVANLTTYACALPTGQATTLPPGVDIIVAINTYGSDKRCAEDPGYECDTAYGLLDNFILQGVCRLVWP